MWHFEAAEPIFVLQIVKILSHFFNIFSGFSVKTFSIFSNNVSYRYTDDNNRRDLYDICYCKIEMCS